MFKSKTGECYLKDRYDRSKKTPCADCKSYDDSSDMVMTYSKREAELEEEARRKAEEEARRKAEEEARRKAEEEARRKAEEEARRKAEEEKTEETVIKKTVTKEVVEEGFGKEEVTVTKEEDEEGGGHRHQRRRRGRLGKEEVTVTKEEDEEGFGKEEVTVTKEEDEEGFGKEEVTVTKEEDEEGFGKEEVTVTKEEDEEGFGKEEVTVTKKEDEEGIGKEEIEDVAAIAGEAIGTETIGGSKTVVTEKTVEKTVEIIIKFIPGSMEGWSKTTFGGMWGETSGGEVCTFTVGHDQPKEYDLLDKPLHLESSYECCQACSENDSKFAYLALSTPNCIQCRRSVQIMGVEGQVARLFLEEGIRCRQEQDSLRRLRGLLAKGIVLPQKSRGDKRSGSAKERIAASTQRSLLGWSCGWHLDAKDDGRETLYVRRGLRSASRIRHPGQAFDRSVLLLVLQRMCEARR